MANPYPMQGQMMQQPPQQPMGPPMGNQNSGPPGVRRGTSKAVPVVMSAGLAIGVFCGLLFGVGVDKDGTEASAATTTTTTTNPKKADADVPDPFKPERKDVKVPTLAPIPVKPADGKPADAKPDSGSPQVAGTGSGGKTVTPIIPTKVVGTLKVEVLPDAAAKIAKISIDGKDIEGLSYELDMTDLAKAAKPDPKDPNKDLKKEVKVTVKASGYIDRTSKVEIVAERDTTLKLDLIKRATGGNLPRPVVPSGNNGGNNGGGNKPPPKCKKPPCGLIDI